MSVIDFYTPFPELETPRLLLREITPDDAPALFEIFSDEEVMTYWSRLPYTSIEDAQQLIERIAEGIRERASIEWAITLKGQDRLIGKCGFHRWYKQHLRAEVGYAVARPHWGQGIVREALRAILDVGFRRMELHSVEAQVHPDNLRSVKTLEGLGFVKEGHLKENFMVDGKLSDTAIYSLLKRNAL